MIHFHIPVCSSLKEKRSIIKPLIERVQRQFNVSVAEVDYQDSHHDAKIAIGVINNDNAFIQAYLSKLTLWIEQYFSGLDMIDQHLEIVTFG